jgi:molybdate transport system ATP-binding protein
MSEITAAFRLGYPGFSLDVDLKLPGRGVTALFGQSGCGKTTILRCFAGLERADRGHLSVNGEVWQDDAKGIFLPTHRRPLGYVFQEASLFPHLTVKGNLEFGLKRIAARNRRVAWDQAVELMGIGHLLERTTEHLSGGERQRIAIVRALLTSPNLLLMDEPMAALDQQRKQEILPYLERLHDELEIPVVYVSHAADEVARLADHLVVLESGRATASGKIAEVLSRLDPPIRLGEDAGVVFDASVASRDEPWHLIRVEFAGGGFWVRDSGLPIGHHARVRVLARDVSIALEQVHDSSIQNTLPATVLAIGDDEHPALVLVRLRVGAEVLLARLTRRSAAQLALVAGMNVWVQIKAVALL